MSGVIDIVCNLFTPREVKLEQTGLDETFKEQIRMDLKMRKGVTIAQYLKKMDAAGIERSLLIAEASTDFCRRGTGWAAGARPLGRATCSAAIAGFASTKMVRSARICSGVVPQHPPSRRAP